MSLLYPAHYKRRRVEDVQSTADGRRRVLWLPASGSNLPANGGELATKYRYTGQFEEFADAKHESYNYGAWFYDPNITLEWR